MLAVESALGLSLVNPGNPVAIRIVYAVMLHYVRAISTAKVSLTEDTIIC